MLITNHMLAGLKYATASFGNDCCFFGKPLGVIKGPMKVSIGGCKLQMDARPQADVVELCLTNREVVRIEFEKQQLCAFRLREAKPMQPRIRSPLIIWGEILNKPVSVLISFPSLRPEAAESAKAKKEPTPFLGLPLY